MSTYWTKEQVLNLGTLDASGANSIVMPAGMPVDVFRIILVTTVAQTVADATISVGVRNVDDTSSVTKGSFVLPFTGSVLNQVQHVIIDKANSTGTISPIDGSLVFTSGEGVIEVNPGQELFLTSDGGGNAGTYQVYVEYILQGFSGSRVQSAIERTYVSA